MHANSPLRSSSPFSKIVWEKDQTLSLYFFFFPFMGYQEINSEWNRERRKIPLSAFGFLQHPMDTWLQQQGFLQQKQQKNLLQGH